MKSAWSMLTSLAVLLAVVPAALRRALRRQRGPEITPETSEAYRCAISNTTAADFLTCLNGAPKPPRPEAFPDRRQRVSSGR